ncbi:MAG: hypothetical protein WCF95_04465, partial [bacterium]
MTVNMIYNLLGKLENIIIAKGIRLLPLPYAIVNVKNIEESVSRALVKNRESVSNALVGALVSSPSSSSYINTTTTEQPSESFKSKWTIEIATALKVLGFHNGHITQL